MAFTFTEKAAAELRERIRRRVTALVVERASEARQLFVGTIHAYCFRFLPTQVLAYEAYTPLDQKQLSNLLSREGHRLGVVDLDPRERKSAGIQRFLRSLDVVENELMNSDDLPDGPFKYVVCRYCAMLDRYRFMSFGTQVVKAVEALQEPSTHASVTAGLRHLIVDEYHPAAYPRCPRRTEAEGSLDRRVLPVRLRTRSRPREHAVKANTLSPMDIFGNQIRYVVPLYQRPYVWTKNDQWEPLWEDVRTLAERVIEHPGGYGVPPVSPHFLGAIVLDQQLNAVNLIGSRAVIDGQQRLTTLQLLLDAAQLVVAQHGRPIDAESIRVLICNNEAMVTDPDHVFKVWPTDRDQAAFRAAMHDDLVPDAVQAASAIAKAHAYFESVVRTWATEESERSTEDRLGALAAALRQHLRLVVIDLELGDNAQVIFETLNHRGAPLLAADLIKNLVFQLAQAKGLNTASLYSTYWKALDSDYWRQIVAQGRLYRPRIDVFMHRWLTMTLRREVKVDRVFTDFRDSVMLVDDVDVEEVLKGLAADADVHRSWESLPENSVAGRFRYRVLQAMDSQVFAPLFLWLTRFPDEQMPQTQRERAMRAVESWVVRRMLARVTAKDYNNLVIDLLKALDDAGPAVAGETAESFLASSSADSRFWPSDERVRSNLLIDPAYKSMTRARLRMVLEALEDAARTDLGEGQPAPRGLTIEHVMPQGWRNYWDDGTAADLAAAARRDALVHTLGNLSLVTGRLNPTLSNRPWSDAEAVQHHLGDKGKRDYLLKHSHLKLNAVLVHENAESWTEEDIRLRTDAMVASVLDEWKISPDALQPHSAAQPVAADVDETPDVDTQDWPTDDEAVEDARALWKGISPVASNLLDLLISVSPEQVGADDLAEALEIESGARGVAGVLSGISIRSTAVGRKLPVDWREGEPSTYWIASGVAATLAAGKQAGAAPRQPTRSSIAGDLSELLSAGLIAPGDRLVHVRRATNERFVGVVTEDGTIVTDNGTYTSPSPALKDLVGHERNGWTDWTHGPSGLTLADLRATLGTDIPST